VQDCKNITYRSALLKMVIQLKKYSNYWWNKRCISFINS